MNYEELEKKIDKICEEVDELLKNDIDTLESTSRLLYNLGAYSDPQDKSQYESMLKHIEEQKK